MHADASQHTHAKTDVCRWKCRAPLDALSNITIYLTSSSSAGSPLSRSPLMADTARSAALLLLRQAISHSSNHMRVLVG